MCNYKYFIFYIISTLINVHFVDSKCEVPIKLYEDLQCKPIYGGNESLCPKQYDCSRFQEARMINNRERKCFFGGVWYAIGEYIQIPAVCSVGVCECTTSLNFECTKRECEYVHLPDASNCFLAYGFDECCPQSFNCLNEWKNISTCNVKGTIYLEGEIFPSPQDNCKLCVCNKEFDDQYDSKSCRLVPCRIELFKSADLLRFCAPVYLNLTDCCPVDIKCPSKTDIETISKRKFKSDNNSCTYGELNVPRGVHLMRTEEIYGSVTVTECNCVIPPFMTCVRKNYT